MEKINIAELLKNCPKGMELDCTMFEQPVKYMELAKSGTYIITVETSCGKVFYFTKEGYLYDMADSKCIIFPKGKTTWEGFHKPFEDGDIIYTKHKLGTEFVSIFQREYERDIITYWDINLSTNKLIGSLHEGNAFKVFIEKDKIKEQRIATEEEKAKLFQAFIDNGYKWNAETKTLEKLVVPKFKVGDKVRHKNNHNVVFTITSIEKDTYVCGSAIAFWFDDQDMFELVPKKFDLNTLKPFDKVLVRCSTLEKWRIQLFEKYDKTYQDPFICLGCNKYKQCIPYEGNEHLLDIADNCSDYFKIWE